MTKSTKPPLHVQVDQALDQAQDLVAACTTSILKFGLIDKGLHDGIIQGHLLASAAALERARALLKDFLDRTPAELRQRLEREQGEVTKAILEALKTGRLKP